MPDTVVSGKGYSLKKCLLTAGLLVLSCLPAAAERKGTFGFGIQAGSSIGFRPEFGLRSIEDINPQPFIWGLRLYHNFCGHIQYNISERFGLRFDLAYQNGTYMSPQINRWTLQSRLVTVGSSFHCYSLNGVYSFPDWKDMGFFFLGGAGIGQGDDWLHGADSFFVFKVGAGVNIYLNQKTGWASTWGSFFHHLYDPTREFRSSTIHANWISFTIGVKYAPRVHSGS